MNAAEVGAMLRLIHGSGGWERVGAVVLEALQAAHDNAVRHQGGIAEGVAIIEREASGDTT